MMVGCLICKQQEQQSLGIGTYCSQWLSSLEYLSCKHDEMRIFGKWEVNGRVWSLTAFDGAPRWRDYDVHGQIRLVSKRVGLCLHQPLESIDAQFASILSSWFLCLLVVQYMACWNNANSMLSSFLLSIYLELSFSGTLCLPSCFGRSPQAQSSV